MMRVNDELWVPKDISLKASARLALLKKLNVEQTLTFSDYRKFQTDSRVVSTGDAPDSRVAMRHAPPILQNHAAVI